MELLERYTPARPAPEKTAGLIQDYQMFVNSTSSGPED
jgi:hypothetical protein